MHYETHLRSRHFSLAITGDAQRIGRDTQHFPVFRKGLPYRKLEAGIKVTGRLLLADPRNRLAVLDAVLDAMLGTRCFRNVIKIKL